MGKLNSLEEVIVSYELKVEKFKSQAQALLEENEKIGLDYSKLLKCNQLLMRKIRYLDPKSRSGKSKLSGTVSLKLISRSLRRVVYLFRRTWQCCSCKPN